MNRLTTLFLAALLLCLTGCGGKQEVSPPVLSGEYEDVIFSNIWPDDIIRDGLHITSGYAKAVSSEADFLTIAKELGVKEAVTELFDDAYFKRKDLLVIAFHACPDFEYTIDELTIYSLSILVIINQYMPHFYNLLGTYMGVFIELDKNPYLLNKKIDLAFREIIETP